MANFNIVSDLCNHIERTYWNEYDDLITVGSSHFKSEMMAILMHWISFNVDVVKNERFTIIAAKCLASNMTVVERDDFIQNYELSHTLVNKLNDMSILPWPEPLNTLDVVSVHLDILRARLIANVNYQAGRMRSKLITVSVGKDMVYIGKWIEARDFQSAQNPTIQEFPLLALEIGGMDFENNIISNLTEAAAFILAMQSQWKMVAVEIEKQTKIAVAVINNPEITDRNQLVAAANIDWPTILPFLFAPVEEEEQAPPEE